MDFNNKKVAVTGGAGFIGSWLVERLVAENAHVTVIDNLMTGKVENLHNVATKISFLNLDVRKVPDVFFSDCDFIFHLACPAATEVFTNNRSETLDICYSGTKRILEGARINQIPVLFTSSSEVYGTVDGAAREDNKGNVSFTGIRSGYDEGKRVAEALIAAYKFEFEMEIYVVRLFNTFGGRMTTNGRLISTLIKDVTNNGKVKIFGDGEQTRSLNYVVNTLDGIWAVLEKKYPYPINVGGDHEMSVMDIAKLVFDVLGKPFDFEFAPRPEDEPQRRKPDLGTLRSLDYEPMFSVEEGIKMTYEVMKKEGLL